MKLVLLHITSLQPLHLTHEKTLIPFDMQDQSDFWLGKGMHITHPNQLNIIFEIAAKVFVGCI